LDFLNSSKSNYAAVCTNSLQAHLGYHVVSSFRP
jgi:hypothetical protein